MNWTMCLLGFPTTCLLSNPDEVSDFDYVALNEVLDQAKLSPQNYTVWFKKIIERVATEISLDKNK